MKKQNLELLIILSVTVLIFVTMAIVWNGPTTSESVVPISDDAKIFETLTVANFVCRDGSDIIATFSPGKDGFVSLVLSDGRSLKIPQVISASGARYATPDEKFVFWNKGDSAFILENGETTFADCSIEGKPDKEITTPPVGMANPASTNCVAKGGKLTIQNRPDGGQYGLCYFEDNRACEEWTLFRGDCPVGGMRTTGYDTDAQKFCAWVGGQTYATENAVCNFKDQTTCGDDDYFAGNCRRTTLDEATALKQGEVAFAYGPNTYLKVKSFINSPCPQGANCIWSGLGVNSELYVDGKITTSVAGYAKSETNPYEIILKDSDYKTYATFIIKKP